MSTPDLRPSSASPASIAAPAFRLRRSVPAPLRLLVVLLLGAALLSGCFSSEPTLPAATRTVGGDVGVVQQGSDGVQTITLETGDDYVFTPTAFTVAPGEVRLTVRNTATQLTHNFLFTSGKGPAQITEQIPVLAPGQSQTIDFTVTTPGDYQYECSFHASLGQVGTMTVSS